MPTSDYSSSRGLFKIGRLARRKGFPFSYRKDVLSACAGQPPAVVNIFGDANVQNNGRPSRDKSYISNKAVRLCEAHPRGQARLHFI